MKYLTLALIALSLVGCRAVTSNSAVTNTFTAGNDIVLKDSGTEGLQETIQAADKKIGDISPNTTVKPGL